MATKSGLVEAKKTSEKPIKRQHSEKEVANITKTWSCLDVDSQENNVYKSKKCYNVAKSIPSAFDQNEIITNMKSTHKHKLTFN